MSLQGVAVATDDLTSPSVAPRRSYLFAPGNSEKLLGRVFEAGADAVVLDLEDSVPEGEKEKARAMVAGAVSGRGRARESGPPQIWVRINGPDGPWREDVAAVVRPGLFGVRLPKAARLEEVVALHHALLEAERGNGVAPRSVAVALTIESASGVVNARALARGPRVRHLCLGAADLARDLGVEPEGDEIELLLAKQELVIASRAAGIDAPVASVHTDLEDLAGLERTTRLARRLGFFGRSCIHPKQLAPVHQAFAPAPEAIEAARRVRAAWAEALSRGSASTTTTDRRFVDRAIARRAEATLALAATLSSTDQRRVQ